MGASGLGLRWFLRRITQFYSLNHPSKVLDALLIQNLTNGLVDSMPELNVLVSTPRYRKEWNGYSLGTCCFVKGAVQCHHGPVAYMHTRAIIVCILAECEIGIGFAACVDNDHPP
jgi:hypothetical protein